jgi:CheY-like chemotaxis protein
VIAPTVGKVSGDPGRLQQVIWNLLSNAVKFTPAGGRIEIELSSDTFAQIRVTDTGRGIDPEFLPHAFDYFRQADGTTTRHFGGLGLGLAIARHIVKLHGGTITATSPGEGQGATFIVRLPLSSTDQVLITGNSSTDSDVTPSTSSTPLAGLRILVVDDEADTHNLLTFALKQVGAEVMAVSSATAALSILLQVKPDILLSDIGMPDTDGYRLIQQVRA